MRKKSIKRVVKRPRRAKKLAETQLEEFVPGVNFIWKKETERDASNNFFTAEKGLMKFPTSAVFASLQRGAVRPKPYQPLVKDEETPKKQPGGFNFSDFLKDNFHYIISGVVIAFCFGMIWMQLFPYKVNPSMLADKVETIQVTQKPVAGKTDTAIQWIKILNTKDLEKGQKFISLPKDAKNIKLTAFATEQEAQDYIKKQKDHGAGAPLTLQDRQKLSGILSGNIFDRIKQFFDSASNLLMAYVSGAMHNLADLFTKQKATVYDPASNFIREISTTSTDDSTLIDISNQLSVVESMLRSSKMAGSAGLAQESSSSVSGASNPDSVEALAPENKSDKIIVAEYVTPSPKISEKNSNNGKVVTVSAKNEPLVADKNIPAVSTSNVIAYAKVQEIYKLGEESRIKLKWRSGGGQNIEFSSFDLNSNGFIDYIEWIVPHLSDQIFEIIFISKAFQLDSGKNIIGDIYSKVENQDGNWAELEGGQYVRVTFQRALTDKNDITLYAKPNSSFFASKVEVYAENSSELLATFPEINEEGTYKVFLTNLNNSSDTFDLKIIGDMQIDYIVDPSPSWLEGWSYRKKITIDNTNVDNDLENFPLYVRINNDSDIGTNAQNDGDDIRFTDSGGTTLLKYEEESWTGGGGSNATADYWVKVPSITSASSTDIYIYYGKADAADGQDVTNVWDSNFKGVWHLPNGSVLSGLDSTANNNDGSVTGAVTAGTGKIDGGANFAGSNDDYFYAPGSSSINITGNITMSAWVNYGGVGTGNGMIFNKNQGESLQYAFGRNTGTHNAFMGVYVGGWGDNVTSSATLDDSSWYYVTAKYDGVNVYLYINGTLDNSAELSGSITGDDSGNFIMGADTPWDEGTKAVIDEARLSATDRSASWIKFEYNNMASEDYELTFFAEEEPNSAPNVPTLVSPADASYANDNTPALSANYSDPDAGDVGTTNYGIATSSENCLAETFVSGCGGTCTGTSSETADEDENTTWTPDSSIGSDAVYYWCAQNNDGALTSLWTEMGSFTLDTAPPVTSDDYLDDGQWVNSNRTVTITPDDSDFSGLSWTKYCITESSGGCAIDDSNGNAYGSPLEFSTEGISYLRYASKDNAGNTQTIAEKVIKIDKTSPIIDEPLTNETKSALFEKTIESANDGLSGSGVATYQWSQSFGPGTITFGTANAVSTTISADTDGEYVVSATVTDYAGNTSNARTFNLTWDTASPTTSDDFSNNNTWAGENQTITLTPADETSGVSWTKYCTDETNECSPATGTAYTEAVTISTEGTTYFRYASQDNAGNTQTTVEKIVKIDKTGPSVYAGADVDQTIGFTQSGSASDSGSGMASYLWAKVSGPGTLTFGSATSAETTISASENGTYVIRLTATDNAGNSNSDDFTLDWTGSAASASNSSPSPSSGSSAPPAEQPAEQQEQPAVTPSEPQTPPENTNLVDQIADQLNNIGQNIQNLTNQVNPSRQAAQNDISGMQNQKVMDDLNPLQDFSLLSMDSTIAFFAEKSSQLKNTLNSLAIDVEKMNDVKKLQGVELILPSLTQMVFEDKNKGTATLLADMTVNYLEKIPSDIVFARVAGGLIDLRASLNVDKNGLAQQKIKTISKKPMQLIIRPDRPAERVTGLIVLDKVNSSLIQNSGNNLFSLFSASLATVSSQIPSMDSLLVKKFAYQEKRPGVFEAEIESPSVEGEYQIVTVIEYKDKAFAPAQTQMTAVVDPEGYVYRETSEGRIRIKNATVSLYQLNSETGQFELWDGEKFLQKNPIITDETGKYSFLVPQGTYYINASARGYMGYQSNRFDIADQNDVRIDIELQKISSWPSWLGWPLVISVLLFLLILIVSVSFIYLVKSRTI